MEQENSFKNSVVLIVEDVSAYSAILEDSLIKAEWKANNILKADTTEAAIAALEDYYPHLVLLDLMIPYRDGEQPKIGNSVPVLEKIEYLNLSRNLNIKVIVVSGSVGDPGIQKLITGDRKLIVKFLDKSHILSDSKFKSELVRLAKKSLSEEPEIRAVTYMSIRRNVLKDLKKWNESLWKKIDTFILKEFESLYVKNANVEPGAKQIIGTCGEIVEDIICYIQDDSYELANHAYEENHRSVRNKLTALTGRKFAGSDIYEKNPSDQLISRAAAEYASLAYKMRSEAIHSKADDEKNNRIYREHNFTREDAAVSVNLIVPLIQDYMLYKLRKKKGWI